MGAGRAGWYSYDLLDNGGRRSSEEIIPEFQKISIGALFPALPGVTDAFLVLDYKPESFLVLGAEGATWAFLLEPAGANRTRLITRARGKAGDRLHSFPVSLVKFIHLIMERKQLLEIARRAERRAVRGRLENKSRALVPIDQTST